MNPNGLPQPGPIRSVSPPQSGGAPVAHSPQVSVSTQPMASSSDLNTEAVVLRARQLVLQYQSNPYALSEALQQLKVDYLRQQFNISVDSPSL